jgi:hypothetical protein
VPAYILSSTGTVLSTISNDTILYMWHAIVLAECADPLCAGHGKCNYSVEAFPVCDCESGWHGNCVILQQ